MTSNTPVDLIASLLERAADAIEETLQTPTAPKEASNTTGGTWEPSAEEGEILNPAMEAQRILAKAEAAADEVLEAEVKSAVLIEVARAHTQIGAQLLSDFDF